MAGSGSSPTSSISSRPTSRCLAYPSLERSGVRAGGAHHTVLTRALGPEPLIDLAEMVGVELLVIDEGSTLPAIHRELRWNEAYYHLARGL